MQFELFILILTVVLNLLLGLIVLIRNPKSAQSKAFFLLCLSLCLWVVSSFYTDHSASQFVNLFLGRLDYLGGIFIVTSILLVCENFGNEGRFTKRSIIDFITILTVVGIFSLTPYVVASTSHVGNATVINPGSLYFLYPIFALAILAYGLFRLWRIRKKSSSKVFKTQATFVFFALLISFPVGIFLAVVLPALIDSPLAVKLGPLATLIMVVPVSFAIVRHKLFDIRAVVARSVTYILTIGLIAILYGFIAFRFAGIFLNNLSPQTQQTFYVILTVFFAFTFAPLRRFFEKLSNNIFYRGHYDSQQLVNEIGRILASEIDLDKVSTRVLHEVTKQIKIHKGEIIVFGEKQLFYENNVFKNGGGQISPEELRKLGRLMVVADDMPGGDRKDLMQRYGIKISLALRTSEKFIGYMLLGEKKSGDIYNDEDLRVLKIIANEVSVGIANALSYKEVQEFSETLAERVRQRTVQLRHANDQLKELDKAKDEFISMASHQLRTPLTTVKGYASMLQEGDFGKLSKEQLKIVDQTLDGSNRMARLIDDLLNVSRMDANRFFLEADKVDIAKLVTEELDQLKALAESKKIQLTYTAPKGKIPIILLDENKTRQVVMNITDNAIHYSAPPAGGGHVNVSMALKGNYVEFLVKDDGIGVPLEAQKKLFTKMFRAANAQGVRPDGTGLGLYLVKRVVEEQGGEILFESQPGKGSTFGFRLPLSGIPKQTLEESKKIGAKVAASHAKQGN
jgi:signal transduction histidine kinase